MSAVTKDYILRVQQNVPQALLQLPVWLLWRSEKGKTGEKPKKVPYYSDGVRRGKTDTPQDRSRLLAFGDAASAFEQGDYTGLGTALGEVPGEDARLAGIDFDGVIHDGVLDPRVQQVIAVAGSYAETSVGGSGMHIVGLGQTGVTKRDRQGLEIYDRARFLTLSGLKTDTSGTDLSDIVSAAALARTLFPAKDPTQPKIIEEGSRHNSLIQFVGTLRNKGLSDDELTREAFRFNDELCKPPLPTAEVQQVVRSATGWTRRYALNDTGNARRAYDLFGPDLRYVPERREYIHWDGNCWRPDTDSLRTQALLKDAVQRAFLEVPALPTPDEQRRLATHLVNAQNTAKLEAAARNLRSEPGVAIPLAKLDADRYVIGAKNGAIDLRTAQHRAARREDFITKSLGCGFDPDATAPTWELILRRALREDEGFLDYVQRLVGMSLLGNLFRIVVFIYGPTGTAKSVFLEVVKAMFGDYGKAASADLLMRGSMVSKNGPSEGEARLAGAKLVTVSETTQGTSFDDALIKDLSGNDTKTARNPYERSFEFKPDFVIWIRGNHKPRFSGDDPAMVDRLRLLPFDVQIPVSERIPHLAEKVIREELPGVLNWALVGALKVQRDGLPTPDRVREATAEYVRECDPLGLFIDEGCYLRPDASVEARQIYIAYRRWCGDQGISHPWTQQTFGRRMGERFQKIKRGDRWLYTGIGEIL